jgi:hypothetical protein
VHGGQTPVAEWLQDGLIYFNKIINKIGDNTESDPKRAPYPSLKPQPVPAHD